MANSYFNGTTVLIERRPPMRKSEILLQRKSKSQ
jgi:hypothetical protein